MSRKMSKALVIDASVARSAGETEHPVSSACRQTLLTVLKVCHRVVMCKEIAREWKKHQSRYSSNWLAAMQSKGKIVRVEIPEDKVLTEKLERLDVGEKGLRAMLKDLHLVEAARQTDFRIVSGDEAARGLFRLASEQIDELRPILWVNPVIEEDNCIEWLKAGAKKD
jgi:hypothetical protein